MNHLKRTNRLQRSDRRSIFAAARGGFSMLELLIVIAILSLVFGLAIPNIMHTLGQGPLQEKSQEVREAAVNARIWAIDTGLIYQLRYEVDGQSLVVVPFEQEAESLVGEATDDPEAAGGTLPKAEMATPEQLSFRGTGGESVSGERLDRELFTGMSNQLKLADLTWSPAIKFYPDGSADQADFEIMDEKDQAIGISIRDLTGAVTVSRVISTENER